MDDPVFERYAMPKRNKYNEDGFFKRLTEVLKTEKQNWWAKKTGTSQSMVSNYWFRGKYPRGDKIAKILELKNISANWLYFGIGPKHIADLSGDDLEKKQNKDRQTQIEIIKLAEENVRLKDEIQNIRLHLKQDRLVSDAERVYSGSKATGVEDSILETIALTKMVLDVIIKMAQRYAEDHLDNEKMGTIIDWLNQNKEAKKFSAAAMLRELEQIIQ
jgi:transcriptional regulator with XRE-family HTH domain